MNYRTIYKEYKADENGNYNEWVEVVAYNGDDKDEAFNHFVAMDGVWCAMSREGYGEYEYGYNDVTNTMWGKFTVEGVTREIVYFG